MRYFKIILSVVLSALLLVSCIKAEAPNSEADIISISVPTDILLRTPVIGNNDVTVWAKAVDLSAIAPEFEITAGATIEPASGTVFDWSGGKTHEYTVTSEDRQYSKTYTVAFKNDSPFQKADFEYIVTTNGYHEFVDTIGDYVNTWASGNAGFKVVMSSAAATDYPTSQSADGYEGNCAKLVTRSTGTLGKMFGSPMAAGSLFLGTFSLNLTSTSLSTHFGIPFTYTPISLTGYYSYTPGDTFTDASGNTVSGKTDDFAVYAVFFETTDDTEYLDGTNILSSDLIVSTAILNPAEHVTSGEWTRFELFFELQGGKSIDEEKLAEGRYSITIVMSSSQDGDNFNGAVGSTLLVDKLEIFYE